MAIPLSLLSLFLISLTISISSAKPIKAINGGFTVELIHRDSPNSPLYNPAETPYERVAKAVRRSISRANKALTNSNSNSDSALAPIFYSQGEFVMKMSLGTPPFPIAAIPDTGSDIIWTQCKPCSQCFPQSAPLFDSSKSQTYTKLPCPSPQCSSRSLTSCSSDSFCQYSISYGDNSHSNGDVSLETITLSSTTGHVSFPKIVIGCGHDNGGTFDANVSGIIGLGRGPMSLVSQMRGIGGKFSYCLTPFNAQPHVSSKITFGTIAVVSGTGTVSTPIVEGDTSFYQLTLEAISVGDKRIEFQDSSAETVKGNIIIDSGTTLTMLPQGFYSRFAEAVSDGIKLKRLDDPNKFLEFCFETATDEIDAPTITAHFDGADVVLGITNAFIRVADEVLCLAFVGIDGSVPIYGNVAQSNFLIGYDTQNMAVSFKPADCAAH